MLQEQEVSQNDIDRALASIQQKGISHSTKPVLQVNIERIQQAQNGGFPKNMSHSRLEPRQAFNDAQESMLRSQGYQDHYILKHYPKYLHRRNLSAAFDPDQNPAKFDPSQNPAGVSDPFVESRQVLTAEAERALITKKPDRDCGPWVDAVHKLEPVADSLGAEDLAMELARSEARV